MAERVVCMARFFNNASGEEGFHGASISTMFEVQHGYFATAVRLWARWGINHVQSMGMQQSQLRI